MSQRTAFFHLGELIEFGKTSEISPIRASSGPRTISPAATVIGVRRMQQASGHTLKAFDEEIERLRGLISQMGGLANMPFRGNALPRPSAISTVPGRSSSTTSNSTSLELETERRAVLLIALRAPMAADLRDVVAALKISGRRRTYR